MTESDWQSCTDPKAMLEFLRSNGKTSDRKLRLFAAACCRTIPSAMKFELTRRTVEVIEHYADGLLSQAALLQGNAAPLSMHASGSLQRIAAYAGSVITATTPPSVAARLAA